MSITIPEWIVYVFAFIGFGGVCFGVGVLVFVWLDMKGWR